MNKKKVIYRVSINTIVVNALLSILKFVSGIIGHSQALVSDAIHSVSDVFTTIIVMIGAKISNKKSDDNHPYGHERFECVFSVVLAISLAITGIIIGYKGLEHIIKGNYNSLPIPTLITVIAAIISIIIKELLYWYTMKYAKVINSTSLKADAKHHRSDSLSSIGSLIGVLGSRIGFPILDNIASIIICIFILKTAISIFMEAMNQMVDRSCSSKIIEQYINDIKKVKGVIDIDLIKTRLFGTKVYIDLEISVDSDLSLIDAHNIAETVHDRLEEKYPNIKHCMVHVNPYQKK